MRNHQCKKIFARGLCQKCYFHFNYLENRDKRIKQVKEYYQKNKNRIYQYQKQWNKENPDKIKKYHDKDIQRNYKRRRNTIKENHLDSFYSAKQRAKYKGLDFNLDKKFYLNLINKQNNSCFYCGIKNEQLGLDRTDNNKGYTKDNIVIACRRCNTIKNDFFSKEEMIEISNKFIKPKLLNKKNL